MRDSAVPIIVGVLSVLLLGACSGAEVSGPGGTDVGVSATGEPIVTGEWPFNSAERCLDEAAPACDLDEDPAVREWSGMAGVGSVFSSDVDVTVEYRGGLVHRESTADAVNDQSVHVVAFFDVTFPESSPIDERLLSFNLGTDLNFQITNTGTADVEVWPGGPGDVILPEPGEVVTFAVSAATMGPRSLLGEGDPVVHVNSNYTYNLGPDHRTSGSALFATLDQDPDPNVLDDALVSIESFAERGYGGSSRGDSGGFERVFAHWLNGAPLVSVDAVGTAAPADDSAAESVPASTLPAPAVPEATEPPQSDGDFATFSAGATDGLERGRESGRADALNGSPFNDAFSSRSGEYYAYPDSDEYMEGFDLAFAQGYREAYEEVTEARSGGASLEGVDDTDEAGGACDETKSLLECYG